MLTAAEHRRVRVLLTLLALPGAATGAAPGARAASLRQAPAAASPQSGQPDRPQLPPIRSGTSLLRVEAAVLDGRGRPVPGLRPDDFQVEIDGTPRRVRVAEAPGVPRDDRAGLSFFTNTGRPAGRALAVVLDLESVEAGAERPMIETAARFVESLPAADAVALFPLPGAGLPFTRDHRLAGDRIRALRGASQAARARHTFTFDEALAYERGDQRVIEEVVERECARDVEAARAAAGLPAACPSELVRETRERRSFERQHIELVLTNVAQIAGALRDADAPATLVLISGGMDFDTASLGRYEDAARALKAAGVATYAVQMDQPAVDASAARPGAAAGGRDRQAGLANVATMAGGAFFAGVARAEGVFERMRVEIGEPYILGVEAAPADFDGRPHSIRVRTSRPGITIRSRPLVAPPAGGDPGARLARLMQHGVDAGDLPIALATQTVRGDAAATVTVRVRAEIGRGNPGRAPVRYAAAFFATTGAVVLETGGEANEPAGPASVLLTGQLAPGAYRLRVAAVDEDGRAGSVDVPLAVGMRAVGGLQASDVIAGRPSAAPSLYLEAGEPVEAAIELSTADVDRFRRTSLDFEVAGPSLPAPVTVAATLQDTAFDRQKVARASLQAAALPPGEYTLSAVVKLDGVPAGRIARTLVLVPSSGSARQHAASTADAEGRTASSGGAPATASPQPPAAAPQPATASPPSAARAAVPDAALADLLRKVGAYVDTYGDTTGALIALEDYVQFPGDATERVRIQAEFALLHTKTAGWLGYRDVIQVNGKNVPDRQDRLLRIVETSGDPAREAAAIAAENARFNIGPVTRNFNVPTTALLFFRTANLPRFVFERRGARRIDGTEVIELAFRETTTPTLIATRAGKDVPSRGTLWVSPLDGAVIRTRLQVSGFADGLALPGMRAPSLPTPPPTPPPQPAPAPAPGGRGGAAASVGTPTAGDPASAGRGSRPDLGATLPGMIELHSRADIEVTFERHPQFGMWLPARMSEEYEGPLSQPNRPPTQGLSRARATYSGYRRFETGVRIISHAP